MRKVEQALIMAGGKGTRLGLGTKSHILYKGKIVLEYLIEGCIKAGIKNIVVALYPRDSEKDIEKEKFARLNILIDTYPTIKFVRQESSSFREAPDKLRKYLDQSKPFYLLCGQSPQSAVFLKKLSSQYKLGSIVASGYKYRHDYIVSIGRVMGKHVLEFKNIECTQPKDFIAMRNEEITHFPYILTFDFYDKYLKKDGFKNRFEFYPNDLLKDKGKVYVLKNPVTISEVDYEKDLTKLFKSIDRLVKTNYKYYVST